MSNQKTPPSEPQLTVPYDQFQIFGLVSWIEANGYKPHLLVDTRHPGVKLPPQCMAKNQEIINIYSAACAKFGWMDDRMEFNTRFGGKDFRLVIPYHAIQAINFANTGMWIPMPWTQLVAVGAQQADVQITAVSEPVATEVTGANVDKSVVPTVEQIAAAHAHIDDSQTITDVERDTLLGKAPDERVSGIQGSTVTAVDFRGKTRLPK